MTRGTEVAAVGRAIVLFQFVNDPMGDCVSRPRSCLERIQGYVVRQEVDS